MAENQGKRKKGSKGKAKKEISAQPRAPFYTGKGLIIVESPAKARTLSSFLRGTYRVEASLGHVIDLPERGIGVRIEEDFEPVFRPIPGKNQVIQRLKKAGKEAREVLLATDPDREGEAIAWHIAHGVLGLNHLARRIEFHEITRSALERALQSPRQIDMKRVEAQIARRILDRLVGYQLSPLLWQKVKKGLSAGRVQSVAVRLICDREADIRNFTPEEYWVISALFLTPEGTRFKAVLESIGGEKVKMTNENQANSHIENIRLQTFSISSILRETRTVHPFAPFITSTLQQEASKRFHFSPRKTMQIAQKLYEGIDLGGGKREGLITYMRTDSVQIAFEALEQVREFIGETYGSAFVPERAHYYRSKATAQRAHEAIRPTRPARTPEEVASFLTADEQKLYDLIWRRFVASQMALAVVEKVTITTDGGPYRFIAEAQRIVFDGFLKVYPEKLEKGLECFQLKEGGVNLGEVKGERKFTQPPPRYTVASLIKALEEKGIGRPSTYAPILQTIQERGYVKIARKKKRNSTKAEEEALSQETGESETQGEVSREPRPGSFYPTPLGETINNLLVQHFSEIVDYDFTAQMESNLDRIEEGALNRVNLLKEFYVSFQQRLNTAKRLIASQKPPPVETEFICEKCGSRMVIREGRYGKFLACSSFPKCRNTRPLEETPPAGKCPLCGSSLRLKRTRKRQKVFYSCSTYPKCKFATWDTPTPETCPRCGSTLFQSNTTLKCLNPTCNYTHPQEPSHSLPAAQE